MSFFNCNALKCVPMNNQECKVRPEIININSNEALFYPFSVKISKCSGICNNINDSYAKLCVPNVSKNMNVKAFNLISRTNETRYIKWHETCKCRCIPDASICTNKQRWNEDKCRCECKELIDKGICDKGFNCNPSNCEFECDKSCDVGEYLDCKDCTCRKRLVYNLAEQCGEDIDEKKLHSTALCSNKVIYNSTLNAYGKICICCTVYIVLFVIFFIISTSIRSVFIYFPWHLKRKYIETKIY